MNHGRGFQAEGPPRAEARRTKSSQEGGLGRARVGRAQPGSSPVEAGANTAAHTPI